MLFGGIAFSLASPAPADDRAETTLTVMSFNVWGGGANEGRPIDDTVAVIRAAGADVIGLQETRLESAPCEPDHCPPAGDSIAAALAAALGFHYHDQTAQNDALWANAILSRYPIEASSANDLGVRIDVAGRRVFAYNVHLDDSPYQPYQLLGLPYGDAPLVHSEGQAIEQARRTRGPALRLLFADLQESDGAAAAFVFGDFNEPSHRDWTRAAASAGLHPISVRFPTAAALEARGFIDVIRFVNTDEVARPAFTWPVAGDPEDPLNHPDRIDFVFARGDGLVVESAVVLGEDASAADIVVQPWPSDHRAVAATVRF